MRIDKLSLLNFRCFRQLDITFDEHITILVAPNGAGKTTVLDAIRLALFPFIRGFDASLYVKINRWRSVQKMYVWFSAPKR